MSRRESEVPSVPFFDPVMFSDAMSVSNLASIPENVLWADLGLAYLLLWPGTLRSDGRVELTGVLEHLEKAFDDRIVANSPLNGYIGGTYIPWRIADLLTRLRDGRRPLEIPFILPDLPADGL